MTDFKVTPLWDGEAVSNYSSIGNTLWDFDLLKIPQIWSEYATGHDINVYVVDTGVDHRHHNLHKQIVRKSFISYEPDALDYNGHGTWVCGKLGANGIGMAPNCNLHSLKVLDRSGSGSLANVTSALEWILEQENPHIVNMSLGSSHPSKEHDEICQKLRDRGCILVGAAGNESSNDKSFPAAYESVLAIAAIDMGQNRAYFSNYGEHIVVAAPGVACYSTYLNGLFRKLQGTSMSSPVAAGLLTLGYSYVLGLDFGLDNKTIADLLVETLKSTAIDLGPVGKDIFFGFGGLDGLAFMNTLKETLVDGSTQ